MPTVDDFNAAYLRLVDRGACSKPYGDDYEQVFRSWELAGRPEEIEVFILMGLNIITDEFG